MAKAVAKTGLGPIVLVAIEQSFPKEQRIIEDGLASRILPVVMQTFVKLMTLTPIRNWMIRATEKDLPGIWSCMMCRKRYIDEKLTNSVNQINAVVNLGAGYDTRIYRLQFLSVIPIWEVDQLENIQTKQIRLRKLFGKIPSYVKLIAIDFDHEKINQVLESKGYNSNKKTFFIMEAVTQYLTDAGIKSTFDFLAGAAPGSLLTFTYIRKDFLNGQKFYGWEKGYKKYIIEEKIWIFGLNPEEWPNFLKQYGWKVKEDIGFEELAEKYVKPTGRTLAFTPVERMIYAEKL